MNITIKHRLNGNTLYTGEHNSLREAVDAAMRAGVSLRYANLSYANLSCADLSYANLSCADLSYANLSYADLSYADLSYADLSYANLSYANLSCADLSYANLSRANLSRANLSRAKENVFAILSAAIPEVPGLLAALRAGKINGSSYEGECACLCGTLANIRGCKYIEMTGSAAPDSSRPAERWFLAIRPGMTPENNQVAKITEGWIEEFLTANPVPETVPTEGK
jgi:hypothetical protein